MTALLHRWPLLVVVLVTGCERYPDQPVFVYGKALRVDGSPLAGTPLSIERRANLDGPDASTEGASPFTPYKLVTTTADGGFTLDLLAKDAEELSPTGSRTYRFRTCTPSERGAMAVASFAFNAQDVEIPALKPWDAALTVGSSGSGPVVMFGPPPPAPAKPASAKLPVLFNAQGQAQLTEPTTPAPIVQITSGGALIWQETREPNAWTLTPWLLEDFVAPEVQLRALSLGEWKFEPLWGGSSDVVFRLEWRSTRESLPGGNLQPLSRGATCAPWWALGPCPWTDGQLAPVLLNDKQQAPQEIGIVLARSAHLSRAVIRGLQAEEGFLSNQTLVIEGSETGTDWWPLANVPFPPSAALEPRAPFASIGRLWAADSPLDGPLLPTGSPLFLEVPLTEAAKVRQVRLHAQTPDGRRTTLSSVEEFSLFE